MRSKMSIKIFDQILIKLSMVMQIVRYNFIRWRGNSRIIMVFLLDFILCYLLTDKAVQFAAMKETTMQIFEPFIWSYGDSNAILLTSLLLLVLFADMPFITSATPFYLMRMTRRLWMVGQFIYVILAAGIFVVFTLISTIVLTMRNAFVGNKWSAAAATLAYSGEGERLNLPSAVKAIEMSRPYQTAATIFGLILLYTLILVFMMLFFHIWKGQVAGVAAAVVFSGYGVLLNPVNIQNLLKLPTQLGYKARVMVGWISPLNHATYYMHNFGYDKLPTLTQTFLVGLVLLCLLFVGTAKVMRRYAFSFMGTEGK